MTGVMRTSKGHSSVFDVGLALTVAGLTTAARPNRSIARVFDRKDAH